LVDPGLYFKSDIWMEPLENSHFRKSYDLLDVAADIGGLMELCIVFVGFFIYPISEYSFYISSIGKLFLANGRDKKLFKKTQDT
jgi:hypothetical protein